MLCSALTSVKLFPRKAKVAHVFPRQAKAKRSEFVVRLSLHRARADSGLLLSTVKSA